MRTWLGPWTIGTLLLLSAGSTLASPRPYPECSAKPTDSDVAAAKGAFQAGQASFNEADYERAITYWEDAYRRDCTAHALLLNLARAYELGGDKAQAVEALQTYLARKPESPQKDQINRRIEVLNQQLAKEPKPAAAAPPAEPAPAAPTKVESTPQAPVPTNEPSPDTHKAGRIWVGPLIIGSVGLIAAGTGIIVHNIGRSDEQEAESVCPIRDQCQNPAVLQQGNDGISKQKLGVGLMIGGAAAIGGGLAWFLLSDTAPAQAAPAEAPAKKPAPKKPAASKPSARNVLMLPEVGAGYAGLTLVGLF
jgi:tetratricopeptide (TPR) repeat protein